MEIPFVGGSYEGRSSNINSQRAINIYPIVDNEGGKVVVAMRGAPGLKVWADLQANGEVRGMIVFDGVLYTVIDDTFYSVIANTFTNLGTLNTASGWIEMEKNETQIMIIDGTNGYIYEAGAFAVIADPNFVQTATSLTYQDGYFIVTEPDSDAFALSVLDDGTSWLGSSATGYAEAQPDYALKVISDHRELWIFGQDTTEVYYNSGGAFPFERVSGTFMEKGIAASRTASKEDNTLFWLSDDRQFVKAAGYRPEIISTPQIDYQISKYLTVADAFSFTYTLEGHAFYHTTFPTERKTWVYDISTGFWHERTSFPTEGRHRANCFVKFDATTLLVGDYLNGKIYQMDLDTYTDDGETIIRRRTAQVIHKDRKRVRHNKLELEFEGGVGLKTGQGEDPQVMLDWSDDGGHTWSNEHWRTIGKIGKYEARSRWNRVGNSRQRIYQIEMSDPVKYVLIGAYLDALGGRT